MGNVLDPSDSYFLLADFSWFLNTLNFDPTITAELNENINSPITKDEIIKGIKNLKNNKAFGDDQVINCSEQFTQTAENCNRSIIFGVIFVTFIFIKRFYSS
jgi:hypothetical protein